MLLKTVKELSKHSLVYSSAWFSSSFASVILLPIYTRYIPKAEYGILEMLDLMRAILNILILTGIGSAIGKFYYDAESREERLSVMSTAICFAGFSALIWTLIALSFDDKLSLFILGSQDLSSYLDIAVVSLFFDILVIVCLVYYQVEKLSGIFVSISLFKLLINVALNIILIVVFSMGAKGMLYGGLFSS